MKQIYHMILFKKYFYAQFILFSNILIFIFCDNLFRMSEINKQILSIKVGEKNRDY